jgi:hypothetical protein
MSRTPTSAGGGRSRRSGPPATDGRKRIWAGWALVTRRPRWREWAAGCRQLRVPHVHAPPGASPSGQLR